VPTTRSEPASKKANLSPSARADDLLARMTLDEKFAQLTSQWFNDLQVNQQPVEEKMKARLADGIGEITRVGGSSTLAPLEAAKAGNVIQRFLVEKTRLGIPAILHEECCAGYMGLGGTIFPQMIGLASTWNPDLAGRMTDEIRRQMLAIGARQGLGPVLDVATDPRWGRTEETFGEDPFLISRFGVAYIRGLQGGQPAAGVMATGKHFIGHSLAEGGLNCAPMQMGMRNLRETYTLPFHAAIREAGLQTVMNTYNELDGEPAAGSRTILRDLLREELGFTGLVVSDYNAIQMLLSFHRSAVDTQDAAVQSFRAGIDLELPTKVCYGEPLRAALAAGTITLAEIDAIVRRILEVKIALGLFDKPYADEGAVAESFETAPQRALAGEIARQSIVLLKNNGILPLANPRSIAVIGPNADSPRNMTGDYNYPAGLELVTFAPMPDSAFIDGYDEAHVQNHSVQIPSIVEALRAHLNRHMTVRYAGGCPVKEDDRSGFVEAVQCASDSEVVVLVMGDKSGLVPSCTSGETRDRAGLGLPGVQQELAEAIIATGKPVVVVLINGRPMAIPWLQEHAAAIVEAWFPGEEGAAAIVDVLFGKCNPGGKLPITFPRTVGQVPVFYRHKPTGGRSNWHGDYVDAPSSPLYPFGFGLSYTTFAYSDLAISSGSATAGQTVDISLTVANTGPVAGDEVVQLYICDEYASIPRPVKELKGFRRITLDPGESKRITFHLAVNHLAYFDEHLQLVVEAGAIQVMAGSSSEDIRLTGTFQIAGAGKTKVTERIFDCPVTVQ
jgi:beta-glucosidase